jgi:signal transduction histidine kinase
MSVAADKCFEAALGAIHEAKPVRHDHRPPNIDTPLLSTSVDVLSRIVMV